MTQIVKTIWEFVRSRKLPSQKEFKDLTDAMTKATAEWERQGRDINRIFLFLKEMAGEKWSDHFEKVKENELKNGGSK